MGINLSRPFHCCSNLLSCVCTSYLLTNTKLVFAIHGKDAFWYLRIYRVYMCAFVYVSSPCLFLPNQLRIGMKLQKKNWESWQKKTTHCNRIAAVIPVTAMQCRKKSHCLQDSYITSTKTLKALTMFSTQRQGTSKNITR